MKGLIALDIDGTVTEKQHEIDPIVVEYLGNLANKGWTLLFVTGRPFAFANSIFRALPFPFYAALQNGAILLSLPSHELVFTRYVSNSVFSTMETLCTQEDTDFILYMGYEHEDIVYYRPERLSPTLHDYVKKRADAFGENWIACSSYQHVVGLGIASLKCFGSYSVAERLARSIEQELQLHAPLISDPFQKGYYVVQSTHAEATKGCVIRNIVQRLGIRGKVIAAGDDFNDVAMLQEADERIVMATAPSAVQKLATVIAPPAADRGIVAGLEAALERIGDAKDDL